MKQYSIDGESLSLSQLAAKVGVSRQAMSLRAKKADQLATGYCKRLRVPPSSPRWDALYQAQFEKYLVMPNMQGRRSDVEVGVTGE